MKKCSYCWSEIDTEGITCPYCNCNLNIYPPIEKKEFKVIDFKKIKNLKQLLLFLLVICLIILLIASIFIPGVTICVNLVSICVGLYFIITKKKHGLVKGLAIITCGVCLIYVAGNVAQNNYSSTESNYENANSGSYSSGTSSTRSSSSSSSYSSSNECYVCGESASKKVRSYWYCSKHAKLVEDHSYDSNDSYENNSSNIGEGGYEMPNESDETFSDYIKRVDPELYNDITNNYNNATGY